MSLQVIELRHVECEHPGAFSPALRGMADMTTIRMGHDVLPTLDGVDAVIVMGGPMGVGDTATIPWIADEVAFLAEAVRRDVPVWGVCLGSQMLAAALGGAVSSGPPEVGVLDVHLLPAALDDPVWAYEPSSFPTLQWHGDTFEVPEGATLLASSPAYTSQLFRYGPSYGLQFHIETDAMMARDWVGIEAYRESARATLGPDGDTTLLRDFVAAEPAITARARGLMARWLTECVVPAGARRTAASDATP